MKTFFGIIIGIAIGILIALGIFLSLPQKENAQNQQPKLVAQPRQEKPAFKGSISILDAIDKYIEMNPQDSNAYLQKADYLAKQGKLKEALPFYDKALYYDGRNQQAYMNRGAVNYMLGNYEAAKRDLSVAINLDSSKGENFFNRGLANFNLGSYAQAKDDFKQAAMLFNKAANRKSFDQAKQGYEASSALLAQAKINNTKASSQAATQTNQNQQNVFQTASNEALNQKYTSQLMSALSTNNMLEKFKEARQKAGGQAGVMPDFESYAASMREQAGKKFKQETAQKTFLDYKDEAYKKQVAGDMKGALDAINKAIELNPNEADLYTQRAQLNMSNKDPNGAITDYTKALSLNPKDGDSLYKRALAKDMIGDKKGARQDLQQALNNYQEQGNKEGVKQAREMQNLWEGKQVTSPRQDKDFIAGANAFNNGKYQDALKSWDNLIKKYPGEASAYYNRAITNVRLNDSAAAEKDFKQAIALNPNMAEAHDGYSRILLEQGKTEEALKYIDKSLEINPENPNAYMTRGVAKLNQQDPSNAISDFDKALSYGEDNPALYYYRGIAQAMRNNPSAARTDMQEVINRAKDNPNLVEAAKNYLEMLNQQQ